MPWAPVRLNLLAVTENRRSQLLPNVRLDLMGAEHVSLSAREAHELLQREYERWGKIIRESGIKAD